MKYVLWGAVSSGVMLVGMSILFGLSGGETGHRHRSVREQAQAGADQVEGHLVGWRPPVGGVGDFAAIEGARPEELYGSLGPWERRAQPGWAPGCRTRKRSRAACKPCRAAGGRHPG